MKDDLYYKALDALRDQMYDTMIGDDLNSADPEKKAFAEYLLKCKEKAKTEEYTSVKNPFLNGHFVIVKHKRGEPRPKVYFEKMWEKLPWYEKIWVKITKYTRKFLRLLDGLRYPRLR